jgi:hypothetical protein
MPNDVAQGTQGESNHWSAWQVEESTYKIYIEPLLKAIGDAITAEWFRPALETMGMTPEQAAGFELGWDTTAIVARPDDTENLRDLHDRLLISDEYMLTENGVPLDAMPDEEEYTRRFMQKVVLGAPTQIADPTVAKAIGLNIEVAPVAAGVNAEVAPGGQIEAAPQDSSGSNALPATQGQDTAPEPVPEGLVAAAELIVYDALRRAGGRLLTNQNRGQFKGTPRHELHTMISVEDVGAALADSFEFTDRVAVAFGVETNYFHQACYDHVKSLLTAGRRHDTHELYRSLRSVPRT